MGSQRAAMAVADAFVTASYVNKDTGGNTVPTHEHTGQGLSTAMTRGTLWRTYTTHIRALNCLKLL